MKWFSRSIGKVLKNELEPWRHKMWCIPEAPAEIKIEVLGRQCLNRRIADIERMEGRVHAWEREQNAVERTAPWQFFAENARKLQHLYSKM